MFWPKMISSASAALRNSASAPRPLHHLRGLLARQKLAAEIAVGIAVVVADGLNDAFGNLRSAGSVNEDRRHLADG
jgi:hypothetical protein